MPEHDVAHPTARAGGTSQPTPRWGIGDAIVGWLLAQVAGFFTSGLVLGLTGDDFDDLSLGWLVLGNTGLWLAFLAVPLVVTTLKGNGPVVDLGLRAKLVDLAGLPVGALTQFVVVPLVTLPFLIIFDQSADDLSAPARDITDRATDPFSVAMLIVLVGVAAPIFEEIFYRGLVQRSLERRYGPQVAIGVTALVFGLSHFQLLQTPGLVAFGVVVGVLAWRTGRLGPSIATHMGFNLVSVAILLATG